MLLREATSFLPSRVSVVMPKMAVPGVPIRNPNIEIRNKFKSLKFK